MEEAFRDGEAEEAGKEGGKHVDREEKEKILVN